MEIVHIAWALANGALIILVIRFWVGNFEFYSDRYGRWPGYLLILVSVVMCSRPGAERQPASSQPVLPVNLAIRDTLSLPTTRPVLYDAGIYHISGMWITKSYSEKKSVSFNTSQSGIVLGINWKPEQESIWLTRDGHLHYSSTGTMTWSLFGFPLYSDLKTFAGEEVLQSEPHRPRA